MHHFPALRHRPAAVMNHLPTALRHRPAAVMIADGNQGRNGF